MGAGAPIGNLAAIAANLHRIGALPSHYHGDLGAIGMAIHDLQDPTTRSLLEELAWLRALARTLARDPHLADDLVQDACALALQRDEPPRQPRAWLKTVVTNLWKTRGRDEAARRRRETVRREDPGDDAVQLTLRAEAQQSLVAAVLALDEPYRSTVLLRYFDGLPPRRIARQLAVPVATVHSRLQRALKRLRGELDRGPGGRQAWLLAFAPFLEPVGAPLLASPVTTALILMQTKLKILAVAAVIACTAPLWWPTGEAAADTVLADGPDGADRAGGSQRGGGGAAPAGSAAQPNQRTLVSRPAGAAAPGDEHFAIQGRVCDCMGVGLADVRIATADGSSTAETTISDAGGRFELQTTAVRASLTAADDGFVTVLAGDWSRESTIAPVVVVARSLTVAGQTLEASGVPVAGSRIELELPDDFDTRFSLPLDRAGRGRWHAISDEGGAFRLPRLPLIDGATLLITADAYAPVSVPLPATSTENLQVVLELFRYREGELVGRVLDPAGSPAAGARVAMGLTSVVADEGGRFGLSLRRAGWPTAIVAAKAGYLPARLELPSNGGKRAADWDRELVLRLGSAPQSVRGRVVDQDGKGIAGAEVWLSDPTPFGIAAVVPMQLEYLIGGGAVPPMVARMPVPHADDPTADGNFMDQSGVPTASAAWFYVTTDDQGAFELPGLLDRPYRLKALDPSSGLFGEVGDVMGGSWQEIRIAREAVWPELRGRVVSLKGRPVAGVGVQQFVVAFKHSARVPGGRFEGTAMRRGRATTTGEDGTFVLRDVGHRFAHFSLAGDKIVPTSISAEGIGDPLGCTFEVEARCHVEVVLFDSAEADEVLCLDGNGEQIDLAVLRRNSNQFLTEVPLHDGRSGLFVVGERAATIVLLRAGEKVREIPITPEPAQTTTVH